MMRFCPNCDNILIPRDGKLFCKACEVEFKLDTSNPEDYTIKKSIKHDEKEAAPIIIKEGLKGEKISAQDRKAYEEFFGSSEMDSF
ncbi:MAG: hypothetical protein ACFE9I_00860 [Candidatus Hermodarchaeota archaeon]